MIRVKNIILPFEPLTNFDLINAVKELKIKCFRGVYLLDTLPGKPNKKECGIVNLDKSGGPGTHWVAWYKNGKNKIYFDSSVLIGYSSTAIFTHLSSFFLLKKKSGPLFKFS